MVIQFQCPNCDREATAPDERAGTGGRCPACGVQAMIPLLEPPVARAASRRIPRAWIVVTSALVVASLFVWWMSHRPASPPDLGDEAAFGELDIDKELIWQQKLRDMQLTDANREELEFERQVLLALSRQHGWATVVSWAEDSLAWEFDYAKRAKRWLVVTSRTPEQIGRLGRPSLADELLRALLAYPGERPSIIPLFYYSNQDARSAFAEQWTAESRRSPDPVARLRPLAMLRKRIFRASTPISNRIQKRPRRSKSTSKSWRRTTHPKAVDSPAGLGDGCSPARGGRRS